MLEMLSTLATSLHFDVLIKILLIDLALGLDNAIVIALATSALAVEVRNKVVLFGTAGAIIARIVLLFLGFWLVGLPFVKLVAGGYLIYLAYSMLTSHDDDPNVPKKTTLLGAAYTIVVADVAMSLDNVIALVSASEHVGEHAFWYTTFGIVMSIPIIIFASKGLLKLIEKFPVITYAGSGLIAWVGADMLLREPFIKDALLLEDWKVLAIKCVAVAGTTGMAWLAKNRSKFS